MNIFNRKKPEILPWDHDVNNDYDGYKLGATAFPKGCSYCGGRIRFSMYTSVFGGYDERDRRLYICSNDDCAAFCWANNNTDNGLPLNYPLGIIADASLRNTHSVLRSKFERIWKDKNVINTLLPGFMASWDDGEKHYGVITSTIREEDVFEVMADDGITYKVPRGNIEKIDYRSKGYFWLSQQMKIPFNACKIPMFSDEQCECAMEIINETLNNLKK